MTNKIAAKETEAEVLRPADAYISMIERVAMSPNSDLEKLERMLQLKEKHDAQEAQKAYAAAFALASSSFPTIPLNGKGHNNKPYATLEDITKLTRPVLAEHGFALTFSIDVEKDVIVTAKLMHKAGHCEITSICLPRDTSGSKNGVQAVGSTQTYGQRYTAQAILGLSLGQDTEDDGRTSGKPIDEKPAAPRDLWVHTVLQDLPEDATDRDKAMALTAALTAQFGRMKGKQQIINEWDRRAHVIGQIEGRHPDLHETIVDAYQARFDALAEEAARKAGDLV